MAEVTLSNSNSKIVVAIGGNQGFLNRVKAIIYEHALNLRDGTPSANEGAWADAVLGGATINEYEIAIALAVQADPSAATLADTATDAQIRGFFDLVISRCIDAWVAQNP